jgi:stringent starvation protein B
MSEPTSTKPYLLRALYEWCVDNGFTPYLSVHVDADTRVPMEYVRDGEIVLNIGPLASNRLQIGQDRVEFAARFGGVAREISIPIGAVTQIYARENGEGMSFPVNIGNPDDPATQSDPEPPTPEPPNPAGRPTLRRVK